MFVWDDANADHIWDRHRITTDEAEQAVTDPARFTYRSDVHTESRHVVVGATEAGRLLAIVVTRREKLTRVVTAREANEWENQAVSKAGSKGASVRMRQTIEVAHLADVPEFANDKEAARYWDTHRPSEAFLDEAMDVEPEWLPPVRARTTPVAVRFDQDVVKRLKALAAKKHKGYQTLLKEFVAERLYEEEKREGIIPS